MSERPVQEVLGQLKGVKRVQAGQWIALCPAHDDRNPSLSVGEGADRRVLLHCHRGCDSEAIVAALGLTMSDLFPPTNSHSPGQVVLPASSVRELSVPVRRWSQEDADAALHNRGLRTETTEKFGITADLWRQAWRFPVGEAHRLKSFVPNGSKFQWDPAKPQIGADVYGLEALNGSDHILLVEGEPDVWIGQQAGLPAVTFTLGATSVPEAGVRAIADSGVRSVTVLYDADEPGHRGSLKAAEALREAGVQVEVRQHTGLPSGGDLTILYSQLEQDDEAMREAVGALPKLNMREEQSGDEMAITLDDFYAYMPSHKYIFVPTREPWPATSVNARLPLVPCSATGKPIKPALWLDMYRAIEQMTWAPGKPLVIEDRLVSHGGWINQPGCMCFNLYRGPEIQHGDPGAAGPWLDHVARVYPNDADHIVAWLAHRVQRPGEKINHGLVLGGLQGIGKDTLLEPVKHAVGPWNFAEISPVQLTGRFNGFMKSVILRVSEAHDLGNMNRYAFYEHTKAYLASPPNVLLCDEKNIQEHSVMNVCGVVLTTNYKSNGIYLPADDRRHYVAWSELTKEGFTPDYWTKLWGWYQTGGHQHVSAYLADFDLSDFDAKAPPPKTPAFWDIVDSNRAPEDAELADALDALGNPDATTLSEIVRRAKGTFADWLRDRKNRRQIPHRMETAGYVRVRNDGAKSGLWVIAGERQVVYARRELLIRDRHDAVTRLLEASRR